MNADKVRIEQLEDDLKEVLDCLYRCARVQGLCMEHNSDRAIAYQKEADAVLRKHGRYDR